MWGWIMRLFESHYDPLDRPPPLSGACDVSIDDPRMAPAREIQHDADNIIAGIRGQRDLARRRGLPDPFIEGMRGAWHGEESS